jgi:EAL domain-containing protein (putative c-di-GMP-specific phosphodiesterase class I)
VVVAEGVENEAQLARVRDNGCDLVQGFFYSYPLPLGSLPCKG